ncbi:PLP-dependent transferase [Suillus hirtellus]|nr:PLP-dependent transferase [Suillus hirtellus]
MCSIRNLLRFTQIKTEFGRDWVDLLRSRRYTTLISAQKLRSCTCERVYQPDLLVPFTIFRILARPYSPCWQPEYTVRVQEINLWGVYTCEWHEAKGYWFEPPTVSIRQGRVTISLPPALSSPISDQRTIEGFETLSHVYDVEQRLESPLAKHYRQYLYKHMRSLQADDSRKLAALIIEPIVMGAGGMIFVDPLLQRIMVDVVRDPAIFSTLLPVIFDEVLMGLYRLGFESAGPLLGVNPDISVNAKILTGGLLPLAVTLASDRIFSAFKSESKVDALLHGHSYTAHAVGCQVANATLDLVGRLVESDLWVGAISKWTPEGALATNVWSFWDPEFITSISCLDIVDEAMALGTVLAIKFKDDDAGNIDPITFYCLDCLCDLVAHVMHRIPLRLSYRTCDCHWVMDLRPQLLEVRLLGCIIGRWVTWRIS